MCGRFTLTASADLIRDLFEVRELPPLEARYNIAPTQDVLAIREAEDGREALMMRWGLIPHWADDKSIGSRLINARSETVAVKPAFRDAFEQRRCLIPSDGFFEWKKVGDKKQPYWLHLKSGDPFAYAGLWERWRDEGGEWIQTCTVLTTRANDLVEPIHDRMPVILPPGAHAVWLATDAPRGELEPLFEPFPASEMDATAVSTRVNRVANDDAECLARVETQGSLL